MHKIVIATLSTALTLSAWAPTATAASEQQVKPIRIARVSYDPPGSDTGTNAHLNREWVAIKNFGQQARQLRRWTLRDTAGHVFHFPRFRLRPGTTVSVHTGHGQRTRHDLYWGSGAYIWNNTGDRATLRNSNGLRIDRCSWGDGDGLKNC